MGLATEGDNIGVYKAYIKDANSLKDLTLYHGVSISDDNI
jgi:hypothetical protein